MARLPSRSSTFKIMPCAPGHHCAGGVNVDMLAEAVKMIGGRCKTEASGNVTLETVSAIAQSDCDYISCGALTHSVTAMDISFNIVLDKDQ